jgi:hypothetical protein
MYQQYLAKFPMTNLVVAGELIFFFVFVGISIWVFRPGSAKFYADLSARLIGCESENKND